MTQRITLSLFLLLGATFPPASAIAEDATPFLPTWKLLSPEAKEQFIAGYMQGWRDAEVVTDVATQYIKENPKKALEGLEKIRTLYDMSAYRSSALVGEIDRFYQNPTNSSAALSKAVSAARQSVSR